MGGFKLISGRNQCLLRSGWDSDRHSESNRFGPLSRGGNSVRPVGSHNKVFTPHRLPTPTSSLLASDGSNNDTVGPSPRPSRASSRMSYPHSTSPTLEHADPFGPSAFPRRYVYGDNDSDNVDSYGRRDTYASDSSNNGLNDPERYYDHNGTYDPYGEHARFGTPLLIVHMAL